MITNHMWYDHTNQVCVCIMVNNHSIEKYALLRKYTKRLWAVVSGNLTMYFHWKRLYFCNRDSELWQSAWLFHKTASLEVGSSHVPEFCPVKWEGSGLHLIHCVSPMQSWLSSPIHIWTMSSESENSIVKKAEPPSAWDSAWLRGAEPLPHWSRSKLLPC